MTAACSFNCYFSSDAKKITHESYELDLIVQNHDYHDDKLAARIVLDLHERLRRKRCHCLLLTFYIHGDTPKI
jgi:hypothetical protein